MTRPDQRNPSSKIWINPDPKISGKMSRISQNPYTQQDLTGPKSEISGFEKSEAENELPAWPGITPSRNLVARGEAIIEKSVKWWYFTGERSPNCRCWCLLERSPNCRCWCYWMFDSNVLIMLITFKQQDIPIEFTLLISNSIFSSTTESVIIFALLIWTSFLGG